MHLLNVTGHAITGTADLISFVKIFYSNLYGGNEPAKALDENFSDEFFSHCPTMDRDQQALLARPLSLAELRLALGTCKESAPGLDGIPYSFYKAFPEPLLGMLIDSWNYALQSGNLTLSHRQSCLTLLPKKGKDHQQLGNWRPISLSACDLKLITKAYANRLKLVLPEILCQSQAAYIPGRDISFNNRLLNLAKRYAREKDEDFCIVSLDAKKAFDSVSHCYLVKVLKAYNFPQEFIQVFQILYADLESVVQVNGHLSSPFPIKNGVKQGDALSCGLFVLAMDPLIRNILSNDFIEGVLIPTSQHEMEEIKVLAYADDITIVCRNSNLQPIFSEYERLSLISGLTLNADKTEILNFIPSRIRSNRIDYLDTSYILSRVEEIKICGMHIASTDAAEYHKNVVRRIEIMEGLITGWSRRQLTMNGRMILAKTFVLSQIVFPAQFIEIRVREIKKIERLIYSFVSGARNLYGPEKVARKYLKADKSKGGINGVDVFSFVTAIALRQFGKAAQLSKPLQSIQSSTIATRDDICHLAVQQLKSGMLKFLSINPMPDLSGLELVSSAPLHIYLKPNSEAAKLANIYGLIDPFSIQREIELGRLPRTRLNRIVQKLPRQLARLIRSSSLLGVESKYLLVTPLQQCELTSTKVIKQALVEHRLRSPSLDLNKLFRRQDLPNPDSVDLSNSFKNLWSIKHPALRAIRLKLCHRNIFSNERRHRFGIADSPLCSGCGQIETIEHQIYECANAQNLWRMFKDVTGIDVQGFNDLLLCSTSTGPEILKSAIIKALIQISRNHGVPGRAVAQECAYFLRLEAVVNRSNQSCILDLISKLNLI